VIVDRRGKVIAEGAHAGPGKLHAEADALAKLGGKAKGATLYVNLEPCNHHGRTPPCAPAVRDSGVARVVVGIDDPIPGHAGGTALLRRAGIEVTVGVLRDQCARANTPFFTWAREGRAAFTLKAAMTLDGKIATVSGHSKWVTGDAARADVMRLRDEHDAILVGIGTVLGDDPALTARRPGARDPVRIVLDSRLRTPTDAQLLPKTRNATRTILVAGPKATTARERALLAEGAEVWRVPAHRNGKLDLKRLARRLGSEGITSVLVEGGGEVHASFLAQKLADELVLYVAPKIVGGPAKSWVGGAGVRAMTGAIPLVLDPHVEVLGGDLRLTGVIQR
jgi:diaminohydroxyphosphoribosylaminopyrimidine deaminase/5-amino-6-(5-phosphoribosylamino)uracil reductase